MLLSALAAVLLLALVAAQLRAAARALDGHLPGAAGAVADHLERPREPVWTGSPVRLADDDC